MPSKFDEWVSVAEETRRMSRDLITVCDRLISAVSQSSPQMTPLAKQQDKLAQALEAQVGKQRALARDLFLQE